MTSFFGGDPNVSHFTVSAPYISRREEERFTDECGAEFRKHGRSAKWEGLRKKRDEARIREKTESKAQSDRLKELGFKKPYFQYRNKDEAGKAAAKAKAEKFAEEWSAKTGLKMVVAGGFFL